MDVRFKVVHLEIICGRCVTSPPRSFEHTRNPRVMALVSDTRPTFTVKGDALGSMVAELFLLPGKISIATLYMRIYHRNRAFQKLALCGPRPLRSRMKRRSPQSTSKSAPPKCRSHMPNILSSRLTVLNSIPKFSTEYPISHRNL